MIWWAAVTYVRAIEAQRLLAAERQAADKPDLSALAAEAREFASNVPTGGLDRSPHGRTIATITRAE